MIGCWARGRGKDSVAVRDPTISPSHNITLFLDIALGQSPNVFTIHAICIHVSTLTGLHPPTSSPLYINIHAASQSAPPQVTPSFLPQPSAELEACLAPSSNNQRLYPTIACPLPTSSIPLSRCNTPLPTTALPLPSSPTTRTSFYAAISPKTLSARTSSPLEILILFLLSPSARIDSLASTRMTTRPTGRLCPAAISATLLVAVRLRARAPLLGRSRSSIRRPSSLRPIKCVFFQTNRFVANRFAHPFQIARALRRKRQDIPPPPAFNGGAYDESGNWMGLARYIPRTQVSPDPST